MNRSILIPAASLLCLFALAACDEGGAEPNKPATTAPAAVVINDADIAVPAEFEDEAEKTITVATYKAELQTLETEIQ